MINRVEQEVFKKVHLSERKIIFRQMAAQKKQMLVKNDEDRLVYLAAVREENDEKLFCEPVQPTEIFKVEQEVVVNFLYEDESYFFRTHLFFEDGVTALDTVTDLYQLQRRASARLSFPEEYPATANLTEINGIPCFFADLRIRDLSSGGCKLFFAHTKPTLQIEDKINISLQLSHRRPFSFTADVRFVRSGDGNQTFGVQFLNRDTAAENRLLVLLMDLQRELYLKYG